MLECKSDKSFPFFFLTIFRVSLVVTEDGMFVRLPVMFKTLWFVDPGLDFGSISFSSDSDDSYA